MRHRLPAPALGAVIGLVVFGGVICGLAYAGRPAVTCGPALSFAVSEAELAEPRVAVFYDLAPRWRSVAAVESWTRLDLDDHIQEVIDVIQCEVCTEAWVDNGGQFATIRRWGWSILVTAPPAIHRNVRVLLEQLPIAPSAYRGRHSAFAALLEVLVASTTSAPRRLIKAIPYPFHQPRADPAPNRDRLSSAPIRPIAEFLGQGHP